MSQLAIAAQVAADASQASFIREMFEKGRALRARLGDENVFDFSLGNPDAAPPEEFNAALRYVVQHDRPELHRYMPNVGFEETRQAVAEFLTREYRLPFAAESVIMTTGAAAALNVVLRAICDPADEVIVLAPYFPEYRFYVQQAGAALRVVPTDQRFQPDAAQLAAAIGPRTRAVIVNSPNNPTGAVYDQRSCHELAACLRNNASGERPLYLITDDPYRRILYGLDWCPTPVRDYPRSIVVSSYSKDLSIPGERIGYIALPAGIDAGGPSQIVGADRQSLLGAMTMLNRTLGYVNAPALIQRIIARCAAARCDTSRYRQNRDVLCHGLREAGYDLVEPSGALYVFPATPIPDDRKFIDILLEQHILAVPGSGFGRPGHMRLSFAVDPGVVQRSLPSFAAALRRAKTTQTSGA